MKKHINHSTVLTYLNPSLIFLMEISYMTSLIVIRIRLYSLFSEDSESMGYRSLYNSFFFCGGNLLNKPEPIFWINS